MLVPVPKGMSLGFYLFMGAGAKRSDSGELLMIGAEPQPEKNSQPNQMAMESNTHFTGTYVFICQNCHTILGQIGDKLKVLIGAERIKQRCEICDGLLGRSEGFCCEHRAVIANCEILVHKLTSVLARQIS